MKIYIQGFKSIRDGQFVAIGNRLTFLVGPNSAGKSVVLSALENLSGDSSHFKLDMNLIHKNPNKESAVSACHSLGVEWQSGKIKYGSFSTYFTDDIADVVDASIQKNIHKCKFNTNQESIQESVEWDISLNSRIGIYSDDLLSVGMDKLGFRQNNILNMRLNSTTLNMDQMFIDFESIDEKDRGKFEEYTRWIIKILTDLKNKLEMQLKVEVIDYLQESCKKNISLFEKIAFKWMTYLRDGLFYWDSLLIKSVIKDGFIGLEKQRMLNILERYNSKIESYKNRLLDQANGAYPGRYFQLSVVSAERGLPSPADTNCHLKPQEDRNNIFHELMESKIQQEWCLSTSDSLSGQPATLFDCVNKALSDNLFTDNGYQVQVSSKALINKELWDERRDNGEELSINECEFLCKLSLIDSHKRSLTFNDVGSGIGYVLPVLIESFRSANIRRMVFLQQPELHLHPALQTNLTDVLIEASENKRIIAETHSEHMILRALKRIRQTTNGTIQDPTLKLKPEDVAVNYFEPLPDGSTKVHILRISKAGDFLDRWPNGFFEERGQELFDE